eukprot:1330826-Pyramimonas_sp.AAC.1
MPNPTVGQIRRSNALVRRAKHFREISVTFLSIPAERLRFVCHSDYSSKDLDGAVRTQGGHMIGAADPATARGLSAPRGEQAPEGLLGTPGVDHVRFRGHPVPRVLFRESGQVFQEAFSD